MNKVERANLARLSMLVLVAVTGLGIAFAFGLTELEHSWLYGVTASLLLCFGLYMAVYGIDRDEARRHWRIVLIAITFGVLSKYLLIFGATYLATRDWHYAVLGMAVAQIDPLSVAALQNDPRMSSRTKTILNMWASFDDPMTALATPVLLGVAANMAHARLAAGAHWTDVLTSIIPFGLALLFVGLIALRRRFNSEAPARWARTLDQNEHAKGSAVAAGALLAAPLRLYSTMAMLGWVIRPAWLGKGRRADLLTNLALYGATLLLGVLLAGGIDIAGGLVLGFATYGSQIIVAWVVVYLSVLATKRKDRASRQLSPRDVWHLALSQQNGITAIVLALNLEPVINGAVAAVSLAIVVINLLNFIVNWTYDRIFDH